MDINTTEALMIAFYGSAAILLAYAGISKLIRIDMAERKDQIRRENFARKESETCPKCGDRSRTNPDCALCDEAYWERLRRDQDRI